MTVCQNFLFLFWYLSEDFDSKLIRLRDPAKNRTAMFLLGMCFILSVSLYITWKCVINYNV